MEITLRRLVTTLTAALALAGCGSEQEHGGGEAEHANAEPGMTTPQVQEEQHEAGHGEEIGGSHGEAARGPGATDEHDLELELTPAQTFEAGRTGELAFRILDAGGEAVMEFEVEHTKQVHLIVVSEDLRHFQHVHPKVTGQGTWRAQVRPPAPGDYRVVADVRHDGRKLALTADLRVEGEPRATGQPAQAAEFIEQDLTAGQVTTLEFQGPGRSGDYLGAAGHLVIMREGDLEYLHVHPRADELRFEASFPKAGRYVMFLEYERDGEIALSRFAVDVT